MSKTATTADNFTMDDFDDFLPIDSGSVVTSAEDKSDADLFKRDKSVDMSFIKDGLVDADDEEDDEKLDDEGNPVKKKIDSTKVFDDLTNEDHQEEDDYEDDEEDTLKKTSKSDVSKVFKKLIEKEVFSAFDDDKPLDEYTAKDWEELIEVNMKEREDAIRRETPQQFFDALPKELQHAARYVAEGGTDMKSLFKALSHVEEVRNLDPKRDAAEIARTYLSAKGIYDSNEELENQISEWEDLNILEKKALQFKPKLDRMQEEVVESQVKKQEESRARQEEIAKSYMENVYNTLKPGELNGVKLDKKTQQHLFQELTGHNYRSEMTGRPTNLLGHLLEQHQFSENPRYDLIVEATWLLSDPEGYKAEQNKKAKSDVTADTVRKIKTEEGRKLASSRSVIDEDTSAQRQSGKKRLSRPQSIFKR